MTINEIAKIAGVSRATVSRYLNDGYVSEEKKALIAKAIKNNSYTPSVQAQNLRRKVTKQIGVVIPKINSSSVSRMVSGICEVLNENGFYILLANTDNKKEKEIEYLNLFKNNNVDGIILIATSITDAHKKFLKTSNIKTIVLGQKTDLTSSVYFDDYAAGLMLSENVSKNGNTFGVIGVTKEDIAVGQERMKGYTDGIAKCGKTIDEKDFIIAEFNADSGYKCAKSLLENNPKIDTLLCATDTIAAGAMLYLHETGRRIPEDVQIAGVGGSAASELVYPNLTSVKYHYKSAGIFAADLLLKALSGKIIPSSIKTSFDLIKRNSTR